VAIEKFRFDSEQPGKNILIFGAIHGDEHCGPVAIRSVIEKIEQGTWPLLKGSVTFVPICNPKAHEEKKRVRKENLNRIFKKTSVPETEEQELANELTTLVDMCDVLLDIHSSFVPAPTNVFVDYPTEENLAFATALEPEFLIFDWPKTYAENPSFDSWTTDRYAHEAGKIGILTECGQHDAPSSIEHAERYMQRTLAHFGNIAPLNEAAPELARRVYMTGMWKRESAEDRFARAWHHLEFVPRGALIALRSDGEEILASEDCFIIFPKDYALPGGEWFYVSVERE